jgi:hypothetical protein
MSGHPTITLDHHGEFVEIDVDIAPLIKVLWACGIETVGSCQDGGTSPQRCAPVGTAWVAFADRHDGRRFARTCRRGRPHDPSVDIGHVTTEDFAVAGADIAGEQRALLGATFVMFPSARIAEITAALRL